MADYNMPMPIRQTCSSELEEKSSLIGMESTNIKFSQDIISIEIANNSETATIYLDLSGNVITVSKGIPIYPKQYYAADKKIKQINGISLISTETSTDVRIIGHFKLEAE